MAPPLLHPPPLGRPAPIVRDGRDILDEIHLEPGTLERSDRGLPTRPGPLDVHLDLAHALLHRLARRVLCGKAGGKGGPFAGAFETGGPRARPGEHVALKVADGHDRVVERRLDMRDPSRNVLLFPSLAAYALRHPRPPESS